MTSIARKVTFTVMLLLLLLLLLSRQQSLVFPVPNGMTGPCRHPLHVPCSTPIQNSLSFPRPLSRTLASSLCFLFLGVVAKDDLRDSHRKR